MRDYYPHAVEQLLRLGSPDTPDWLNYRRLGIGPEHLAELVRMAHHWEWANPDDNQPAIWSQIHAVRALGELQDLRVAEPLVSLMSGHHAVQRMIDEIVAAATMVGRHCVPACTALVRNPGSPDPARGGAAEALFNIGCLDASVHDECSRALAAVLERPEWATQYVAGTTVSFLAEMNAREHLPLARRVYEQGGISSADYSSLADLEAHFLGARRGRDPQPPTVEGDNWPPKTPLARVWVALREIDPPIWRELEVPANTTLCRLHHIIQQAFGWHDYHLYEFSTPVGRFGDLEAEGRPDPFGDLDVHDATIGDLAHRTPIAMVYLYDFGDSWAHDVEVREISDEPCDLSELPRCIGGARSGPPEDCGGVAGYRRLLTVLADPTDDDHESTRLWARDFDPEAFDLGDVNQRLRGTDWR